ncbi:MAG TPA: YciI family protein [Gemmatimonadaceae bacterium]|jgi:hypothetical protein
MKVMMFIKHPETIRVENVPPGLLEAMGEFVGDSMKKGILVDTAGLKPTSEAKKVVLRGGKISVRDGPFTESKEIVGGYAIVKVKSMDEAMAIGREFMELHRVHWPAFEGEAEVRPLEDMPE